MSFICDYSVAAAAAALRSETHLCRNTLLSMHHPHYTT